jgi:hypothetical protein
MHLIFNSASNQPYEIETTGDTLYIRLGRREVYATFTGRPVPAGCSWFEWTSTGFEKFIERRLHLGRLTVSMSTARRIPLPA